MNRYIVIEPRKRGTEHTELTPEESGQESIFLTDSETRHMTTNHLGDEMNFDTDSIDGYAVPVDPMDLLQCDSCQ